MKVRKLGVKEAIDGDTVRISAEKVREFIIEWSKDDEGKDNSAVAEADLHKAVGCLINGYILALRSLLYLEDSSELVEANVHMLEKQCFEQASRAIQHGLLKNLKVGGNA